MRIPKETSFGRRPWVRITGGETPIGKYISDLKVTMCIKKQIQNFVKLLLVGAVLFTICSAVSRQALGRVSAKISDAATSASAENMFAQAADQTVPESPDYRFIDAACVKAAIPPVEITPKVLGAIVGESQVIDDNSQKAIAEYDVQAGDTIASLAEKFGISANTIIWANDLSKNTILKAGQKLIISPATGVIHYVVAGNTIAQIAEKYKATVDDIIAYNDLSGENDIFIGDVLVVPNGQIVPVAAPKKITSLSSGQSISLGSSGVTLPNNYFLCPVGSACKRNQGLHFRNAVDLGAYCGAPIYAAASGTVEKAKYGWSGGAGNNISISHMNGTIITHYYHLQSIAVTSGQEVKKGDVIGYMGTTGRSTGCHLHFEVIGAGQPF
jgi:LysM repeat protein